MRPGSGDMDIEMGDRRARPAPAAHTRAAPEKAAPDGLKSSGAVFALMAAVALRSGDTATSVLVWVRWARDGNVAAAIVQGVFLALAFLLAGVVSAWRQKSFERRHSTLVSAVLGTAQLQPWLELYDSAATGTKSGCLKLLLNYAAVAESVPSMFVQSFVGFRYGEWDGLLILSVGLAMLSVVVAHVGVEKESYLARGLGKLALLADHSVLLLCFRSLELPARVLSLALFTAEFGAYVLLVLLADVLLVLLARKFTHERVQRRKAAARKALQQALRTLERKPEEVRSLDELMNEDVSGMDELTPGALGVVVSVWTLVLTEGVDARLFLGLRGLESAVMVVLFVQLGALAAYQPGALVATAAVLGVFTLFGQVWLAYQARSSYLRPLRDRDALRRALLRDLRRAAREKARNGAAGNGADGQTSAEATDAELAAAARDEPSLDDSEEEDDDLEAALRPLQQAVEAARASIAPADAHAPESAPPDEERPAASAPQEKAAAPAAAPQVEKQQPQAMAKPQQPKPQQPQPASPQLPDNVYAQVVVREVPFSVRVPNVNRRTQGVQYDWQPAAEQPPAAANATAGAAAAAPTAAAQTIATSAADPAAPATAAPSAEAPAAATGTTPADAPAAPAPAPADAPKDEGCAVM